MCEKDNQIAELTKQLQLSKARNLVLEAGLNKAQEENFELIKKQQDTVVNKTAEEELELTKKELSLLKDRYTRLDGKYKLLLKSTDITIVEELKLEKSKVVLLEFKLNNLVKYNEDMIQKHVDCLIDYNRKILTEDSEVWYWQPDGDNHLNSLVCPLVINMKDMPQFIDTILANQDKPLNEMLLII